jgi:hypothetical protein
MGAQQQNSFQGGGNKTIIFAGKAFAHTNKTSAPRLQFYYFGLIKTENNFQNTKILLSLGCVLANEMRRRASNYHNKRTYMLKSQNRAQTFP